MITKLDIWYEIEFHIITSDRTIYQNMNVVPRKGELIRMYDDVNGKPISGIFEVFQIIYENVGKYDDGSFGIVCKIRVYEEEG